MMALAQSSTSPSREQAEAARRFRTYLDEDWKRWMQQYPKWRLPLDFPAKIAAGATIQRRESKPESNIFTKVLPN